MYDAELGRFVSEDPARDGANWYVYAGGNPGNAVDPWGLFLPGTVLREGAYDGGYTTNDVFKLNRTLCQMGYLSLDDFNYSMGDFTTATTSAIKEFQRKKGLNQTGNADFHTWYALNLPVNTTLAQEFWSGKKGTDLLSVSLSGNTLTITYSPVMQIIGENGKPVKGTEFSKVKNLIVAGFKRWAGNYLIQGVNAAVNVNVNIKEPGGGMAPSVFVDFSNPNIRSFVWTTMVWSTITNHAMFLYFARIDCSSTIGDGQYKMNRVTHTAMHEFGHILGLFDAYKNSPFTSADADNNHADTYDVMRSNPNQSVTDLDIEMVLYAFANNKLQTFGNGAVVGEVSQAYYH
jgi:hypothetical protein